jgi:predicted type IV restriction endonuclease
MPAPKQVTELVERFKDNIEAYKSGHYNETQVRVEFIDPFFEALGWDVHNKRGYAEVYKDVVHEDAIKIGGFTKAPDYCFRVGGIRKFFLEAKKPSINIKEDTHPAYQLRRYAWSAKLPLSILTDFEELAVYDCRLKPVKTDKASAARVLYFTFDQYIERWDELVSIFSQEAILKGSFDKYIEKSKLKRGTAEVDAAFLKEIENWREMLAKNIALRNKGLSQRELNYAIQQTIDRIIFLRICEDRGIDEYNRLLSVTNGANVYKRLCVNFKQADDKYNSGLFHFKQDGSREAPDELTLNLLIDDKPLKEIIKSLYYPDCPYEFSVLPSDILGHVYEQFLGKVIRLTKGHQAVVEDKPEVKKAGGVYYTPTYIVEYIVKNTVGKLLEKKTPQKTKDLKILDPACGSGSFLIGAYQYLLDWHRDRYIDKDPEKYSKGKNPKLFKSQSNEWRLTTTEKKRILLDNIFGVDIDSQAVEVTKLSLLLKVLEGESRQTLSHQLKMFHERALPDLDNNIKCGNSLIGPDFYNTQQLAMFDDEESYRINVFDWETEFSEIMKAGGFDAVISNPPYVFGRDWIALGIGEDQKRYLGTSYKSSPYQLDMFSIFMEKAIELCAIKGYVGYIVPNVWLTNMYSSSTRSFIFQNSNNLVLTAPPKNVFPGITVDTIIYTLSKSVKTGKRFTIKRLSETNLKEVGTFEISKYADGEEPISISLDNRAISLLNKIKENKKQLGGLADITRGVHPYRVGGFGKSAFQDGHQIKRDLKERPYHCQQQKNGFRPFIYGKDLKRFCPPFATDFIKYGSWLAEPRNSKFFEGDRIYSRKILGPRLKITIEKGDTVADQQVYITKPNLNFHSIEYYAAILGSSMMAYFIRNYFDEGNDAFPQIKVGQLKSLPIELAELSDKNQKEIHDKITTSISNLFKLNAQLNNTKLAHEKTALQRQIDVTDKQIDSLVYELYGLTEEEIKIVEGL